MRRHLRTSRTILLMLSLTVCAVVAVWITRVRADNAATTKVPATSQAAEEMAGAADHLLAAVDAEQKGKLAFEFKNEERYNWHFIPRARKGLPIKEMTQPQRHLAQALLNTGLSNRGYMAAVSIMSLEEILKDMEKGKGPARDPEMYFFSIFGTPGVKETWGWRVEGHHLSLNFVIVNGQMIAGQPAFFGTNPARVPEGPRKGLRVLDKEEDMGRALVRSFNEEQQKKAIIDAKAPSDIITTNKRKAMIEGNAGMAFTEMSAEQKQAAMRLVEVYAKRLRAEMSEQDLSKIQAAGWDKIRFAWAGGTEPGVGHYYRIQGPTFLIEYDNTQNNANHVHSVWRDLENDFGDDLLKKHYEEHHQ